MKPLMLRWFNGRVGHSVWLVLVVY